MSKILGLLASTVLLSLIQCGAAHSQTLSLDTITPNPGGAGQKILGSGTWALPAGYTYVGITYSVTKKGWLV